MAKQMTMAAGPATTHVAVELRLTAGEADAMGAYLPKFRRLLEAGVMTCPPATREPLLAAIDKLAERVAERQPPISP